MELKNFIKAALRWVAVPLAAVAVSWLLHVVLTLWMGLNNGIFERYTGMQVTSLVKIILALVRDAAVGGMFVYAGSFVAPSARYTVAVVLATLLCVICIVGFVFAVIQDNNFFEYLGIIASFTGAIIAVHYIHKKNENLDEHR